jgi:hypothetical protein
MNVSDQFLRRCGRFCVFVFGVRGCYGGDSRFVVETVEIAACVFES